MAAIPVSVMIFTLDEETHLPHCLAALAWCDDVVVIDSFSKDRTEKICREAGVHFHQHAFEGFGKQRNWALENVPTKHDWVLILDADERVTPELAAEMGEAVHAADPTVGAYRVRRRFHFWGRWLRHSSLYPTWVVRLVHKRRVRYVNRGHAETQEVQGRIGELRHDLLDENLKGIDDWFDRQNRYSSQDAAHELEQEGRPFAWRQLISGDPLTRRAAVKRVLARLPGRPLWYFLYVYFLRLGFLDGRDGLVFCQMKAVYQRMVAIKKYDMRRRARQSRNGAN